MCLCMRVSLCLCVCSEYVCVLCVCVCCECASLLVGLCARAFAPTHQRARMAPHADVSFSRVRPALAPFQHPPLPQGRRAQQPSLCTRRPSPSLFLTSQERFVKLGIRPPKGVLLYGPPGARPRPRPRPRRVCRCRRTSSARSPSARVIPCCPPRARAAARPACPAVALSFALVSRRRTTHLRAKTCI
jgi:hypothetical protein